MKRLVLIDGMAVIHRAYHALPPMSTREGQPINAVYGFVTMLFRIVDELKPDYLAVAFDLPQPTFRRELYVAYQANRPYPHEDLASQFGLVRELVESSKIPLLAVPGYEADDVIGTIAQHVVQNKKHKTKNKDLVDEVVIVTGDRDMMQLVNRKVKLYMPVKGLSQAKIVDEAGVLDYWDVTPKQIIDLKALIGDSSDNYPGVPGVGPKTAVKLLHEYGILGKIYEAVGDKRQVTSDKIQERVKKKLLDGYESAMLSQKLATIVCDVPLKFDLKDAKVSDFKTNEGFIKKLQEFQFKSLLARLGVGIIKKEKKLRVPPAGEGQMGLI